MSNSRSRRGSRKSIYFVLTLSLLIAIGYVVVKTYFQVPQSIDVFVINPATLTYGDTTISGVLRKDSPVTSGGKYILVLEDGRPIVLDVDGLDNIIGLPVAVSGNLSPQSSGHPMNMVVSSIKVLSL